MSKLIGTGSHWKLLGNQWTDPDSTYMVHSARTRCRLSERAIWVGLYLLQYGIEAPTMPWWIFDLNGHYETFAPLPRCPQLTTGKKPCLLWLLVQKLKNWKPEHVLVRKDLLYGNPEIGPGIPSRFGEMIAVERGSQPV